MSTFHRSNPPGVVVFCSSREFLFSTPVAPSISARRSRTFGGGPAFGGRDVGAGAARSTGDGGWTVTDISGMMRGGALRRGDIGLLGESGVLGVGGVSGAAAGTLGGAPSSLGCRMSPRAVRSSSDEVAVSPFHARGSGSVLLCVVCVSGAGGATYMLSWAWRP